MKEKIILKNGKEAAIIKQLSNNSYVAFYKGIEGESFFIINKDQISKQNFLPYIFIDNEDRPKRRKK